MTQQVNPATGLDRGITRTGYAAITINGVIGAGIFGLPAIAAAKTGAFSPWLFVWVGLLILTVVLSFARASSMFRHTGGMIVYASQAFGPARPVRCFLASQVLRMLSPVFSTILVIIS